MGTPADRVPPGLLRHLHLIVNRKFAKQPRPNLEFVFQVLSHAPELTQHQATVTWRFLSEPPEDGDSMLVWQPPQMGTNFASDGYVWADVDTFFSQEYKGQTLEVFIHRSGLRPGKEPMATHSRRRYRLKQNPTLWLVCYHQADQRDFRPPQAINVTNETRRMLVERTKIEENKSQLVRQEFMLQDTAKYPTVAIHSAASQAPSAQQGRQPGTAMPPMNKNQYTAYMQQQQQQQRQRQQQQQPQQQPQQLEQQSQKLPQSQQPQPQPQPQQQQPPPQQQFNQQQPQQQNQAFQNQQQQQQYQLRMQQAQMQQQQRMQQQQQAQQQAQLQQQRQQQLQQSTQPQQRQQQFQQQGQPPLTPQQAQQHHIHQQRLYQQQQAIAAQAAGQAGLGPPPSKRLRYAQPPISETSIPMGPMPMAPMPVDPRSQSGVRQVELTEEALEDGDGLPGDFMDFLTPRDIALERYVRHHEWLEEVISSPYDTHRIVPPVLGLGRAGELQSLTADFFDTPEYEEEVGSMLPDPGDVDRSKVNDGVPVVDEYPIPRVGRLEGNKAEDFTKRATERVAEINAEMEALKLQHEARMQKLKKSLVYQEAAAKVRLAGLGFIKGETEDTSPTSEKEIEDLQSSLARPKGKQMRIVPVVQCTEKGGQEDIRPRIVAVSQKPKEPEDQEMTGTGIVEGDEARGEMASKTNQRDAADEHMVSQNEEAPAQEAQTKAEPGVSQGAQGGETQSSAPQQETQEAATEDYVMVSKEDVSPRDEHELSNPVRSPKHPETLDQGNSGVDSLDFGDTQQDDFAPVDFGDDGIDFIDNTAGEELSSYAQDIADMGGAASEHSNT